jgi:hypothetical protein
VDQSQTLTKRHDFLDWTRRQNCSPETIDQLVEMINDAPWAAAKWLQPSGFGASAASFVNHHIILAGTKRELQSTA